MKYRRVISFVLACLTIAFSRSATHAQEAATSPKPATGPKVELSLIVTDKSKKSVNSILRDELRVVEEKVEQVVESVEQDNRATDYGLVIDGSGSLRSIMPNVVEAARLIIENRRSSDQIFVEQFVSSDLITILQDFTEDSQALLDSLKTIKIAPGRTAVIDGVYVAAERLVARRKNTSDRRSAIVVITDGEERGSSRTLSHLTKFLREKDIQVFVIGFIEELDRETGFVRKSPRGRAEDLLKTLAEETGGRVFFPHKPSHVADAATQISQDLRSQFRITYQSQNSTTTGFRQVQVKLLSPSGRTAIAPRGYYVESKDAKP